MNRFVHDSRASARTPSNVVVVEVYDFGLHADGSAHIAVELLKGESVAMRLQRGPLSLAAALAVSRQITALLMTVHETGMVHGGLTPDRIFLVPDPVVPCGERVKLQDLGMARSPLEPRSGDQTRALRGLGGPGYMAPEQCRGSAFDHRADLYALGCILFEMLTGRPPFRGEGVEDVFAAHLHVPAPVASSLAKDVPPWLDDLLGRLLEKDPSARPQRAHEVTAALDAASTDRSTFRIIPEPGSAATPTGAPSPSRWNETVSVVPGRSARRLLTTAVTVGALASVVAVAVVVLALTTSRPAPEDGSALVAAVMAQARVTAGASETAPGSAAGAAMLMPSPAPAAVPAEAAPPTVRVTIVSQPPGAKILIAGEVVGFTPYRGRLPRGDRAVPIVLRLTGHRDARLSVIPSAPFARSVALVKKIPTPRRAAGSLNPFGA